MAGRAAGAGWLLRIRQRSTLGPVRSMRIRPTSEYCLVRPDTNRAVCLSCLLCLTCGNSILGRSLPQRISQSDQPGQDPDNGSDEIPHHEQDDLGCRQCGVQQRHECDGGDGFRLESAAATRSASRLDEPMCTPLGTIDRLSQPAWHLDTPDRPLDDPSCSAARGIGPCIRSAAPRWDVHRTRRGQGSKRRADHEHLGSQRPRLNDAHLHGGTSADDLW